MSLHKYFTKDDIKTHLKDYRKIKNFDKITKGIHIKYLVKSDNNLYEYRLGGFLMHKYPEYVILQSQNSIWSVQKKDHIFFYKKNINIDIDQFKDDIKKNNNLIKKLGGKCVKPVMISTEIKSIGKENSDIFSKLISEKKPKRININDMKKKLNIEKWEYITSNELRIGNVICHVSLFGDKLSPRGMISDMTYYENGTIRNITLYNNDNVSYKWKIRPNNYYIFLHPNSAIVSALFISRKK